MKILLYVFSFVWVAAGACFIIYTTETRQFIKRVFEEMNVRILSAAAIGFGLLLLYAAQAARNGWFIVLLGLLSLIKGGLFLANPHNVFETVKEWYLNKATDPTYRFFGIVMVVVGTAVFSWI